MATIYTRKGQPILCDDTDYEWLNQYVWYLAEGYALSWIDGKTISMHRLIMPVEPPLVVDHIDRWRANNHRSNLRPVTRQENALNASRPRIQTYDPVTDKFWLLRGHDLIGIYDTQEEMHQRWIEAKHGRTPAVTNTTIPSD